MTALPPDKHYPVTRTIGHSIPGIFLLCSVLVLAGCQPARDLPFTKSFTVIYDNDSELEGLDLPYAIALASSNEIDLKAVTYLTAHDYQPIMHMAGRSGFRHLPDVPSAAENGIPDRITTGLVLRRPASGVIEETEAIDNMSVRSIIRHARLASPDTPLIIATGGPVTNVASAWLLAPDIADRVIVSSILSAGSNGWNDNADAWAKYIVLQRLRSVIFSEELRNSQRRKPQLSVKRLQEEMPDVELRRYMIDRTIAGNDKAIDIASLMIVVRPGLVLQTRRYSFSHWVTGEPWWPEGYSMVPVYREDSLGLVTVITEISPHSDFTEEYWRAVGNPDAYHQGMMTQQSPFGGVPLAIPGVLEAEHYDYGGEGYASHDATVISFADAQRPARFRTQERIQLETLATGDDGLYIKDAGTGDWFEFTVLIAEAGNYMVELRLAPHTEVTHIHLSLEESNADTSLKASNSSGNHPWHTVRTEPLNLSKGPNVVRLSIVSGSVDIDWLRFTTVRQ